MALMYWIGGGGGGGSTSQPPGIGGAWNGSSSESGGPFAGGGRNRWFTTTWFHYWHLGELKILEVVEVPTVLAIIMNNTKDWVVLVLSSSHIPLDKYP